MGQFSRSMSDRWFLRHGTLRWVQWLWFFPGVWRFLDEVVILTIRLKSTCKYLEYRKLFSLAHSFSKTHSLGAYLLFPFLYHLPSASYPHSPPSKSSYTLTSTWTSYTVLSPPTSSSHLSTPQYTPLTSPAYTMAFPSHSDPHLTRLLYPEPQLTRSLWCRWSVPLRINWGQLWIGGTFLGAWDRCSRIRLRSLGGSFTLFITLLLFVTFIAGSMLGIRCLAR